MDGKHRRQPEARAAIMAATADLIRVKGVAGTSISDVVARSGTSAGAIYHHFGSKERLVLEVGRHAMAAPLEMIVRTATDLSPQDLLATALAQVEMDDRNPALLLQIWAGAQSDPALKALVTAEFDSMRAGVRHLIATWPLIPPTIDPDAMMSVVIGLVTGFAVQRALLPSDGVAGYPSLATALIRQATDSEPADGAGSAAPAPLP